MSTNERRFNVKSVTTAIGWLHVATGIAVVSSILFFLSSLDRTARQDRAKRVDIAMMLEARLLQSILSEYAIWDESYEKLIVDLDETWINENTGKALLDANGFDFSLAIKPARQLAYLSISDEVQELQFSQLKSNGLADLIEESLQDTENSGSVSGYVPVEDDIYLVSLHPFIGQETGEIRPDSYLSFGRRLDVEYVSDLESLYELPGLHLKNHVNKDQEAVNVKALLDSSGKPIGHLTWTLENPAQIIAPRLLGFVIPFLGLQAVIAAIVVSSKMLTAVLSERAQAEEKLREAYTELQAANQTVKKSAVDLQDANIQLTYINQELLTSSRLKDEFLAMMSHELRTPLNAIMGMVECLQENVFGDINTQQKESLNTVEKSADHLLELINEILDLSKIQSGQVRLQLSKTDIISLCESSVAFIQHQACKKELHVDKDFPASLPPIFIDERRIRQVLINLLNNAVKFTPNGGRITLAVQMTSSINANINTERGLPSERLQIAVTDTGIGIAPHNLDKLFDPFIQIDSTLSRKYTGTGLGLALVKQNVELHGGYVDVTSQVDVGSTFTIALPWRAASAD